MPAAVAKQMLIESARQPMPVQGLNFVANTMAMGPENAYVLDNFVARPFGCEVRKGFKYWYPAANKFAEEVRTILVFNARNPANSKLFCAPASVTSPIYNITTDDVAPVVSLTPATPPTVPGEYYYTNYVTPGGAFLAVVAAGAGYFTYSTGGWVTYGTGAGVNNLEFPAGDTTTVQDLCFIFPWKSRLWFFKKDTTTAYYLPVGQLYGKLELFDFGTQLQHGGSLSYGMNWTYDGGAGMDDSLVIVSNQGEVLIYQGTDPSSMETFALKGVWFAGAPPYGRRAFHNHGGDIILVTEYGILNLSDLVAGKLNTSQLGYGGVGGLVNPRVARFVTSTREQKYWFILPYPTEELLVVASPYIDADRSLRITYVMNSLSNAWSTFSGLDILCADMWKGQLMFGTRDGFVCAAFQTYRDGDSSNGLVIGNSVVATLQTNFNGYESPSNNKTIMRAKVFGIVENQPSLQVRFLPEYEFGTSPPPSVPVADARALWDIALWDIAFWATSTASLHQWIGTAAFGKKLALQLALQANSATLLTDYQTCYKVGNGL